ncbi:lysozyme inhibitor LprI family protein [Mesobacterium sp. TK19101]|uniref:Lysozyme inhibitor LprI family protein n=1 Tax=Mesobacterium hydrothermale TaxID=3111907 RepID=A0ABU6HFV8_9RHOB|nr:lysozyme inhibitor LprI family protein [Mesobacterium sp. TK19101]MEC3861012.1 lysozyme inhibitor LprI family protein [Mesobacterium sp. TK19101]
MDRSLILLALFSAFPVGAQQIDCASPMTQSGMTICAGRDFKTADAELNATWQQAVAAARQMDQYLEAGDVPAETTLRDAQRAWISFRDKACEAEALSVRGGSMHPQVVMFCMERLTRARTEDLKIFYGMIN